MSLFEFIGSRFRKLILERRSKALERPETISMIPGPMVINDLPPEILAEIFLLASEFILLGRDIDINDHYGILNIRRSGPLNLVHVCRYWREIALSMQTLWASFDATRFTPKGWAYWSSFSGTSPLRLDFHPDPSLRLARGTNEDKHGWERWRPGVDNTKLKKLKEMLRQFSACADRWDCLYFDCEYYQVTEAIADMLQTTASRSPLRKFEIHLSSQDITPPEVIDKLVSAIASFPSLRQFVWEFDSRQSTLPRPFPWHVLENVYLSVGARVDLPACIQCLMQCTSARNVTLLRRGKEDITGTFDLVHCTLPKLESLTIDEGCDPYIFLGYFTLPSLVSLEIRILGSFSPALQEFLVRSQCPLRTFKFTRGYCMKSDEVVECLSTPYLRTVPNVFASIYLLPIPYLDDIVHKQSDILHTLPGFTAWHDDETSHTKIGSRFRKLVLEPSVKAQERPTQTITVIPRPTIINDHEPGVKAQERPETVSVIPGPVVNEPGVTAEERQETVSVIPGPVVINDLPPEILAEIFVLATTFFPLGCSIDIDHCDYGIRQLLHCGPLNLVPVCRYWREIALSIQTLWASSDATGFTPKAWAYWSSFSKSSPLRLGFGPDLRRGFDYDEGKDWDPQRRSEVFKSRLEKSKAMLHQFAACADRWDCLYFECNDHQVTQAIADMLHTTASRSPLRKISINFAVDDKNLSKVIDKLVSAIGTFPSLREFVFQDGTGRFNTLPRAPDFPWHVLENIYMHIAVDLQGCIQCLMQCTSARHALLICGYMNITGASKLVHSTLPKLESLTIGSNCDPDTFLGYFTFPSLVSLEIWDLDGFSPALEEFLVRSRCPLHTFKFTPGYATKPDKIITCLSAPYLQKVPNVVASISINDLHDIMQKRSESDILRILPRFTAWERDRGVNWCKIGWTSLNFESIVIHG